MAAAGDREGALAELKRAAADLDTFGAVRLRSQAERELRRLGHRIHRRTNSQIASELFLSRRTVETHIRNISRKLDVSSRVEIAKAVERADREAESEARAGQP